MPVVRTRLIGWQPNAEKDESADVYRRISWPVDAVSSTEPSASLPLPHSTPPSGKPNASSATSTSSSVSSTMIPGDPHYASLSSRRGQQNLVRDPFWVPRPRNAFIIFRCQYSREHSKDGNDMKPAATAKTISKKASEAWKQLSPSEIDHFKQLAAQERDEHARKYPNYRFRPVKRSTYSKRNSKTSGVPIFERRKCPRQSAQSQGEGEITHSATERSSTPPPAVMDQSLSTGRRRFNSAPLLEDQTKQPLQLPGETRRARSVAGRPVNLPEWDTLWHDLDTFLSQPGLSTPDEKLIPYSEPSVAHFSNDVCQNISQISEPLFSGLLFPSDKSLPVITAHSHQDPYYIYSPAIPPTSLIGWNLGAAYTPSTEATQSPVTELLPPYDRQCPPVSDQPPHSPRSTWECGLTSSAQTRGDVAFTLPHTNGEFEQARALQAYEMGLKEFGYGAETPTFDSDAYGSAFEFFH